MASLVARVVTLDHEKMISSFEANFEDGVRFTMNAAFAKDNHYTLFRYEDWPAWVAFTAVFMVLITFDNVILNRNPQALTIGRAICYTLFWIACAGGFACGVWSWYGHDKAFMWMSGYMLEWMLSFDNLFVFHLIFTAYGTPDNLKHRPLYLGICGAVFFRLAFIFIGEYLMHAMFFMHLIFGSFLIYSGVKTITAEDEDEDPSQQPIVQWLQRKMPFVGVYDKAGSFFVRVPVDAKGGMILPDNAKAHTEVDSLASAAAESGNGADPDGGNYGTVDFVANRVNAAKSPECRKTEWRCTMLFLVVICLEISDILFAVDSVSAIVAQVPDLFLAYTSAVFAMLGLRATFFIIDVLVRLFSLLKYGVGAVLVFIGFKLMIAHYYNIPPGTVCVVLVTAIATSMVASVVQDETQKVQDGVPAKEVLDVRDRANKIVTPPYTPPEPTKKCAM